MFPYLFLLLTVLPVLELAVVIRVGSQIGAANTILAVILTGALGAYLAKLQGFMIIRDLQSKLQQGEMPAEQMIDGFLIFIGGILLLTPGFITDTLGLLLLIPVTRKIIKTYLRRTLEFRLFGTAASHSENTVTRPRHSKDEIEDAEFHE